MTPITDIYLFPAGIAECGSEHNTAYWEQPFSQPYFDNTTRREVTTTVGQTAHLHCRVRNLGDRAVCIIQAYLLKGVCKHAASMFVNGASDNRKAYWVFTV